MAWNDFVSTASVVLGVTGIAGGSVGFFAKSRSEAIIKAQAELLDVRDKQIADRDKQIAGLAAEKKVLTDQNQTLTGLAQGAPQLVALTEQLKLLPKELTKLIVKAMKAKGK